MEPNTSSSISSARTGKRKLEDVIRTLDDAIVSPSLAITAGSPMPSKRLHLARSVYPTLTKFGPMSKELSFSNSIPTIDVSKSAPHLAAILARSASHSKQGPTSCHPPQTHLAHPASEYRPSSTDSFLSRLATYKITTYANKPPQINAVAAAKCGWINDGKDRLVCAICDTSWVLAGREGMNKGAAATLVEKQRVSLVGMHKDGCPWKARQCEPSVYRVPLRTPGAMVHDLRATALTLEPMLANVVIKHPLTPSQSSSLRFVFSATAPERWVSEHDSAMDIDRTTHPVVPTDTAIIVALFGWVPASTAAPSELRLTSSSFASFTRPYGRSASVPPAPSLSCASSASNRFQELDSAPTLRMSISQYNASPSRAGVSSSVRTPCSSNITTVAVPRSVPLVYCILCLRRVGLWGYSGNEASSQSVQDEGAVLESREHPKMFDLVKEHRSYCPYVVCSSVIPSAPHFPVIDTVGKVTEGWRAVLVVVQRYELSQRQRLSRFLPKDHPDNQASSAQLKEVESMVTRVKTNGGSELIKYVRELLV